MSRCNAAEAVPVSPQLLALRAALARNGRPIATFPHSGLELSLHQLDDAAWLIVRNGSDGGLALRAGLPMDGATVARGEKRDGELARFRITADLGEQEIAVKTAAGPLPAVRVISRFTPRRPTRLPYVPRDLVVLGPGNDPVAAQGAVTAVQPGLNSGLAYFRVHRPEIGNVLYFQNLTALNDYFQATGTKPDEIVGGIWPELGMQLPAPPPCMNGETPALPPGSAITLGDAVLVLHGELPADERADARHFIQMLGTAYREIEPPPTEYRDWVWRAERTLADLDGASEATIRHYGHRYIHPYTDAEYPDAMVQMTIVEAVHEWGKWQGEPHPLEAEFMAGMGRFYDRKLKTIRRYLPNVGDDKNADAVDSWYLYHPLLNLGKLALDGDARARRLFMDSLDYAIGAARHFDYCWPVQYDVTDFSVITAVAPDDGRGQTDVGGLYAFVMLQAFELTDDKRYLDEARAAIDRAIGLGFDINYQANLTAWGAAACMRLWRVTNRQVYLDQSYVYLASFLHHCEIWKSGIGHARHFSNFLGVTCLQDAPYMAAYECFDSYAAFRHYLSDSGPELDPAARMLIAEYCRYALHRAWFYYPDALPPEAIATRQRESNGHVDRALNFPLEDLYPDGQPAGQVGQEVYGAGAAMIFATSTFHRIPDAPFLLHCDHFVRTLEITDRQRAMLMLDGGEGREARISFVRRKRRKLPCLSVCNLAGEPMQEIDRAEDRIDYAVPANGSLVIAWGRNAGDHASAR
jgi:hypothetical protein